MEKISTGRNQLKIDAFLSCGGYLGGAFVCGDLSLFTLQENPEDYWDSGVLGAYESGHYYYDIYEGFQWW